MDRKIVVSVLAAALMGFIGIWLLLSIIPDERAGLKLYPWDVSRDEAGRTRVLGLTLGESTLGDARSLLGEEGKASLFVNPDGSHAVEIYFEDVLLSNLRADWILTMDIDPREAAAMYDRGLRVSKIGSGSRKVKMDPVDVEALAARPIRTLTYLPWKSLEPRDIDGNFGPPAERRTEESGVVHWLYPDRGMDIARDRDGGVVIQYLSPADFERAVALLSPADARTGGESVQDPEATVELR
ncbi:MAG: hypothetical protein PVH47_05525 [Thiohalocapsa sp.]|jgi:hypothetical protein